MKEATGPATPARLSQRLELSMTREAGLKKFHQVMFWNMLVSTMPESAFTLPPNGNMKILALGCYDCLEAKPLNRYFGGGDLASNVNNNIQIFGIDKNSRGRRQAIEDYSEQGKLPSAYSFLHGDASDLSTVWGVPQEVDMVVFRHPQNITNKELWEKIFQQAMNRLSPSGRILVTSYSNDEHVMVTDLLEKLQCEIEVNKENPYASPLTRDIWFDKHIAIAKKKVVGVSSGDDSPHRITSHKKHDT